MAVLEVAFDKGGLVSNSIFEDMTLNAATVIERPAEVVWPHLLNQAVWMKDFKKIETVGGERNQVGELKKITPFASEYQPFFFKTLSLIPCRRFVYKAYTEDRSGRYGFTGLEVLSLVDLGKHSTVSFEGYLEFQSSTMTRAEMTDYVNQGTAASLASWARNFERLSELVASKS